jgi:5-methyltetrahydrofolate--homocysteine methyltransferase
MEVVQVPLCLDSHNPKALEAALKIYKGKPIINSVNGQESSLQEILPLVKEYGAAVIGLTMDDTGIPADVDKRLAIAHKIVDSAEKLGIPREDIIMDCLCLTLGANAKAAVVTLDAVRRVRAELGVNQTLGASNISYGLPDRVLLTSTFVGHAIAAGVTCPTVDVAKVLPTVVATDLVMGRDNYAMRYIQTYRKLQGITIS